MQKCIHKRRSSHSLLNPNFPCIFSCHGLALCPYRPRFRIWTHTSSPPSSKSIVWNCIQTSKRSSRWNRYKFARSWASWPRSPPPASFCLPIFLLRVLQFEKRDPSSFSEIVTMENIGWTVLVLKRTIDRNQVEKGIFGICKIGLKANLQTVFPTDFLPLLTLITTIN